MIPISQIHRDELHVYVFFSPSLNKWWNGMINGNFQMVDFSNEKICYFDSIHDADQNLLLMLSNSEAVKRLREYQSAIDWKLRKLTIRVESQVLESDTVGTVDEPYARNLVIKSLIYAALGKTDSGKTFLSTVYGGNKIKTNQYRYLAKLKTEYGSRTRLAAVGIACENSYVTNNHIAIHSEEMLTMLRLVGALTEVYSLQDGGRIH